MKFIAHIICVAATAALLTSCASMPGDEAPTIAVSGDYVAAGDPKGVKAYIYGGKTLVKLTGGPGVVTVEDGQGNPIAYDREGLYLRLGKRYDRFGVYVNGNPILFKARLKETPVVLSAVKAPEAQATAPAVATAAPAPTTDAETDALLKLAAEQLAEAQAIIKQGTNLNDAQSRALNYRLEKAEEAMIKAATAIVRLQFPANSTALTVPDAVSKALVPAAKLASQVNVRGRTDSTVPGKDDPAIALGRALAARDFLVAQGVDASKIRVFSLPAGDFVTPNTTDKGRAYNRRVDIELVSERIAVLAKAIASSKAVKS